MKYIIILLVFSFVQIQYIKGQNNPIYTDKKTIYTKIPNHEGKNINISLNIYDKSTVKILLSGNLISQFSDTIDIHELNYLPIQNEIATKLSNRLGISPAKSCTEILEVQSIETINRIIQNAQVFLESYNSKEIVKITGTINFRYKVPIYITSTPNQIEEFYNSIGYYPKGDTIYTKSSLDIIDTTYIKNIRNEFKEDNLQVAQVASNDKNYLLVAFIFIEYNELVINKGGRIRSIKMTLGDSIELRYKFGGYRITLNKLGIQKVITYSLNVDLRSIAFSQQNMYDFVSIWNFKNLQNNDIKYYTSIDNLFEYIPPKNADITELFVPKNQRIFFDYKNPVSVSIEETDINNVIKLNLFSDLVGVQENQPNGLIQMEATFSTPLFASKKINLYKPNITQVLSNLESNLKLSKIENKLRYLEQNITKENNNKTFVQNFQLLQYSNLEAGAKINLLQFENYQREFSISYSFGIIRTGLRDTIYEKSGSNQVIKIPRDFNVLSKKVTWSANLKIKSTSKMGMDISADLIYLKLLDNDVLQSGGNYSRFGNEYSDFNRKTNVIFNPQFQAYYKPKNDESQRIYLRTAFFHDIATRSNNFFMVQLGLSSDINKFLNFNNN